MRPAVIALILFPVVPAAAQGRRAIVEIDHATGQARLVMHAGGRSDTTSLGRNPSLRVPGSVPVEVRVVNTNTAIYQFAKESEAAPNPDLASARAFMGTRLSPYLPELQSAVTRAVRSRGDLTDAAREEAIASSRRQLTIAMTPVQSALARLDAAVFGPGGTHDVTTLSLLALEQMRRGRVAEDASARVRQSVGVAAPCQPERPLRLASTESVLSALSELTGSTHALRIALGGPAYEEDMQWRSIRDTARMLDQRAAVAVENFERHVDEAYRAERLATIVAHACSQWSAGAVPLTRTTGRTVTITVQPRAEPETMRIADRGGARYEVQLQRSSIVRPAIALGGVAVPAARFPMYGTRPVNGGHEIIESGRKDNRFGLAGSLGFTWAGLDRRETRGIALWLPEIVVAAGAVRGAGAGVGLSWNFLKLGAGAMWVHHTALSRQVVGQVIASESELKTAEGYGSPRLYITVSVFDWAPFASKIPQ